MRIRRIESGILSLPRRKYRECSGLYIRYRSLAPATTVRVSRARIRTSYLIKESRRYCHFSQVTLKEMEDHKVSTHLHVLCSHFELAGDQREYYQHLYLPGRDAPTEEAQYVIPPTETACTKCAKTCHDTAELHRHMLECGGDHAWLLGLTGSGRKKCKWRPFGSRSRRRRQRGMKRNIQNSQTSSRVSTPKERQQPTGPRVRPSDRKKSRKII